MRHSEFWRTVDEVLGTSYGRSLVADLYLPALRATAAEALQAGYPPQEVWQAIVAEEQLDPEVAWAHMAEKSKKSR